MGQIHKEQARSIALRECTNMHHLQVGAEGKLMYRQGEIDELVRKAGFRFFGSHIQRFSWDPTHGFTYLAAIGESGIMIHTYPEVGTATAWLVTCSEEDESGSAVEKLASSLREYFDAASVESSLRGDLAL